MGEADLRRHLAAQTDLPIEAFDLSALHSPDAIRRQVLEAVCGGGASAVVFDALTDADLEQAARMALCTEFSDFGLGSGGLSYGLGRALGSSEAAPSILEPVEQGLVLVGSVAEQTRRQIQHAVGNGWRHLFHTPDELAAASVEDEPDVMHQVLRCLERGESVILGSSTLESTAGARLTVSTEQGRRIGETYARILSAAAARGLAGRSAIAGGDTSGWAIKHMGVYALRIVGALDVAAAVCALRSDDRALDGTQIVLKGGQVGGDDFFSRLLSGQPAERLA